MNDRADLCLAADFNGVHVGQDDFSPAGARKVIGEKHWLSVSTHNPEQMTKPTKHQRITSPSGRCLRHPVKPIPIPMGLEGVRAARKLTSKPLVAIGGITRQNCRSVIEAGADSVAVISDLVTDPREISRGIFV